MFVNKIWSLLTILKFDKSLRPSLELLWALSNQQSAKRRDDLFQSSFHNRGGSSNPPVSHTGHLPTSPQPGYPHPSPSSVTQTSLSVSSSSSPTPYTHAIYSYPGYQPGYSHSSSSSVIPIPMMISSSSQTPSPQTTTGLSIPQHQWPHLRIDHTLDAMGGNANYAVPPPHPRPLLISPEDSPHVRMDLSCSFNFSIFQW